MKTMPTVYLSYAHEDEKEVRELYRKLSDAGFNPWMVSEDVRPGEDWIKSSQRAIRETDIFLAILSKNRAQRSGFYEQELDLALKIKESKEGVYLVPVRLEDCEVPDSLKTILWIDLFEDDGWDRLLGTLSATSSRLLERRSLL